MDIDAAYIAFLTALDEIPNVTTIGPSIYSTMSNWPMPALTVDIDSVTIGTLTEDTQSIDAVGLVLPIVIHIPIDKSNTEAMRGMLTQTLAIFRQILPLFFNAFPNCSYSVADVYHAVVQFGRGEAFGFGFTLTASAA